jgi:hypothetical protein
LRSVIVIAIAATSACVDIATEFHCSSNADCTVGGATGRCEPTHHCSFQDPSCGAMGFRYHASAGAEASVCIVAPDDMVPAFQLGSAAAPTHGSCAPPGARAAMFELALPTPDTILVDTAAPGSSLGVAFSVHAGPCPGMQELACALHDCMMGGFPTPNYDRIAVALPQGAFCLVVEAADPAVMSGMVALHLQSSGRPAQLAVGPNAINGTTCSGPPDIAPTGCGSAPPAPTDLVMVPVCPGPQHLHAMATATGSSALAWSLRAQTNQLSCTPVPMGTPTAIDASVMGPAPMFFVVDEQSQPGCGTYSLTTTLTPM